VRQLSRSFRASQGRSLGDYISAVRIERARKMLATDQSIKAIGLTLGFSSPSSFSFAFRRATGETPSDYRTRLSHLH
jgi:AraC family transcriptional regulator